MASRPVRAALLCFGVLAGAGLLAGVFWLPAKRPVATPPPTKEAPRDPLGQLRGLAARLPMQERIAGLKAWLEAHPLHGHAEAARTLLADARLRVPQAVRTLTGDATPRAVFTGDDTVVSWSEEAAVRWRIADGEELGRWEAKGVRALAVARGRVRFAVSAARGVVCVDLEPERVREVAPGVTPHALAFTPDGRQLAFAVGGELVVHDVEGGAVSARVAIPGLEAKPGALSVLGVSPNGARVVGAGRIEFGVRTWALPGLQPISRELALCEANAVAFSPVGGRFVLAGSKGIAVQYDLGSGKKQAIFSKHRASLGRVRGGFCDLVYSPDGNWLHTLGPDDALDDALERRIWNAASRRIVTQIKSPGGAGSCLDVSEDGKRLLVVHAGAVEVWDVGFPPPPPDLRETP